jgi:hypothetical protein
MEAQETANEKILAYDLRQRRAKLLADLIEDVVEACKSDNYYAWQKNIDDLFSAANHTFADKAQAKKEYQILKNKLIDLAIANRETWLGRNKDEKACGLIETALRDLFEFVLDQLEGAGVFGRGYEYDENEV